MKSYSFTGQSTSAADLLISREERKAESEEIIPEQVNFMVK